MLHKDADPVAHLEHEHQHLTRLVDGLREATQETLRGERAAGELREDLAEFLELAQEELFEHFDLEETGLFPYIAAEFPDTQTTIDHLEVAHDRMCGVISRLDRHVASDDAEFEEQLDTIVALFARFDANFVRHQREERELLKSLAGRLDATQRKRVAELISEL